MNARTPRPDRFRASHIAGLAGALLTAVFLCTSLGCAAYRFGSQSMFPGYYHTVHVPMFQSESLRRDVAEWLTEAVIKEIEAKTEYKVVDRNRADTILEGVIVRDTKNVLVESGSDQPRALDVVMLAEVRWTDRQGKLLRPQMSIPVPETLNLIEDSAILVPEVGQSVVSSQQTVVHRLAEQIVAMLEVPW